MYHSFCGWMYPLCIWLRAKAAGLTGRGTPETDSAHCLVTASFSNQIFSLAGGHKDPIVTLGPLGTEATGQGKAKHRGG